MNNLPERDQRFERTEIRVMEMVKRFNKKSESGFTNPEEDGDELFTSRMTYNAAGDAEPEEVISSMENKNSNLSSAKPRSFKRPNRYIPGRLALRLLNQKRADELLQDLVYDPNDVDCRMIRRKLTNSFEALKGSVFELALSEDETSSYPEKLDKDKKAPDPTLVAETNLKLPSVQPSICKRNKRGYVPGTYIFRQMQAGKKPMTFVDEDVFSMGHNIARRMPYKAVDPEPEEVNSMKSRNSELSSAKPRSLKRPCIQNYRYIPGSLTQGSHEESKSVTTAAHMKEFKQRMEKVTDEARKS